MAGSWSVLFATAIGDVTIDRFDCNITGLSRYIGKAGTLAAKIPITNQSIGDRCQAIAGRAGLLTAYVYYGADLWWGGLVNSTPLKGGRAGATLDISAATFESYPDRREVRADSSWNQEQLEYPRTAWNAIQSTADGNLGVTVPAVSPASGVVQQLGVLRSEARTWGSVLKETSGKANGYEWLIDVYDDGTGARFRQLTFGYPQIGRARFDQIFSYPGNIVDYTIDHDALAGATSFQSRGDAVGAPHNGQQQPLMSTAGAYDATALLGSGSVRFDATQDRQGVTDPATLNAWTAQALATRAGAVPFLDISVQLGGFNQSILGSTFQAQIDDYAFPQGPNGAPGFVGRHRCIGYEVKPYERGNADEIKLIIEQD
jgi:hypothetical protein